MSTVKNHITIASLNQPITINKFVFAQDDSGGNVKMLVSSYSLMANVEMIGNSYVLESLQLKYGEGYSVIVRFEPSRILTPNDEIVYAGSIHKIQSIRNQDEAGKRFVIINTATGNTQSNTGEGSVYRPVKEFHYTGTGGEFTVQDESIKGWAGIILLFRDKRQYSVIRTGAPLVNQALYNQNTGEFTFSDQIVPLAEDEPVDAYLINS